MLRFFRLGDDFRHMQECLGGDAADIEAYSAECGIAFDQYHFLTEIGGAKRGSVTARPRAQYHYVGMNIATRNIRRGTARHRR